MRMFLDELNPVARQVDTRKLRGNGLLGGGPRELTVAAGQAAIIERPHGLEFHAPAGDRPEKVTLAGRAANALLVPREFRVRLTFPEIRFAGGRPGTVAISAPMRLIAPAEGLARPVIEAMGRACSVKSFERALRHLLEASLAANVIEAASRVEYNADAPIKSAVETFAGLHAVDINAALGRDAGVVISGPIRAVGANCPQLDREWAGRQAEAEACGKEAEVRARLKLEAAADTAGSTFAHERAASMLARRHELEQSQLDHDIALADARAEHVRKSRLAQLEVEKVRAKIARITPAAPQSEQLKLSVVWQTHGADGVLAPRLQPREALPSGTMLSARVTVSRDAWIVIAAKGSSGRWQQLLPEADGALGITRANHQAAGASVTWPGVNRHCPGLPFWCLDGDPGVERLIVAAGVEPISIRCPLPAEGCGYRGFVEQLLAAGCVVHETVVDHIAEARKTCRV